MQEPTSVNTSSPENTTTTCASCGYPLRLNYCEKCGEKRLVPEKDFSLKKFLEQTIDGFTHFDSKFLKSFGALLFRPGKLTAEYIAGRRNIYMKPVQVFIIAVVIFYIIYANASSFFASVYDMSNGYQHPFSSANIFHHDVGSRILNKAAEKGIQADDLVKEIQTEASHRSKTFLFLMIPFLGFITWLLFRKTNRFYVPHLIFAVHCLAFFVMLDLLFLLSFAIAGFKSIGDNQLIFLLLIFITYLFFALKKVYKRPVPETLLKTILFFIFFLAQLMVYRQLITIWSVARG